MYKMSLKGPQNKCNVHPHIHSILTIVDCGMMAYYIQSTHLFCSEKTIRCCEINKFAATFLTGFISPQGSSEQLNANAAIFLP